MADHQKDEQPPAQSAGDLFSGDADGGDLFAQLVEEPDHSSPAEQVEPDPSSQSEQDNAAPASPQLGLMGKNEEELPIHPAPPADAEKDYSDLLAEFEEAEPVPEVAVSSSVNGDPAISSESQADAAALFSPGDDSVDALDFLGDEQPSSSRPAPPVSPPKAAAEDARPSAALLLAEDEAGASPFDDFLAPSHPSSSTPRASPPIESPVPELSIENPSRHDVSGGGDTSMQSLFNDESFAKASDWLGDTTLEESFAVDGTAEQGAHDRAVEVGGPKEAEAGDEPISFQVPDGWYDEAEVFHYYTAEEKEEVRQTMLAQAGWPETMPTDTEASATQPLQARTPSLPYSPGLMPGLSENAARRTPQPEQQAQFLSTDPYAPSSSNAQPSYFDRQPYGQASSAAPAFSSRAPQPSPYAPAQASPYDPYAPPAAPSYPSPYGAARATSYSQPLAGPSQPKSQPPPPPQPKRMVSNAYDPPLRPSKSFIRPPSAVPSPPMPFVPQQQTLAPTSPPPPAAPPPGPPRKPRTDNAPRPASRGPSYAAPPPPRPASAASSRGGARGIEHEMGFTSASPPPPPPLPYQSATYDPYTPAQPPQPQEPPIPRPSTSQARAPPRTASYSSFDPPLRPSSSASARARPIAALASPPTLTVPPPSAPPPGPPRSASRSAMGPPSRRASPMPAFEPPPITPSLGSVGAKMAKSPKIPEFQQGPPSQESRRSLDVPGVDRGSFDEPRRDERRDSFDPVVQEVSKEDSPDPEAGESGPRDLEGEGEIEEVQVEQRGYGQSPYAPRDEAASPPQPSAPQPQSMSPPAWNGQESSYAPSTYQPASPPARSPPSQQHGTWDSSPYQPSSPPRTEPSSLGLHMGSPPPRSQPAQSYDPHAPTSPQKGYAPQPSSPDQRSGYNPYHRSPAKTMPPPPFPPPRQTTAPYNSSSYAPSTQSTSYAPPPTHSQAPSYSSSYAPTDPYARKPSPAHSQDFGASPPESNYFQNASTEYVPQQVLEQRPVSEDALGRCTLQARNAPLAVFGFGGVLITAFPALADVDHPSLTHARTPSYGYASGRGQLWIRSVSELVSPSALKSNDTVFPGPLVLDPSAPKGAAGEKKKREGVVAYLESRAEEIEKGLPYLKSSASGARREEEGKLVVLRVLGAMVAGDGKLLGNTNAEDALRLAFSTPGSSPTTISSHSPTQGMRSLNQAAGPTPGQLVQLNKLILAGDKRNAAQFAVGAGLWAHALVIASSVDQDMWKEVVAGFSAAELGGKDGAAGLKAAYTVFAGVATGTVDELFEASFSKDDPSSDQWRDVLGAVVFNGKPHDLACLDDLGARFMTAGLVNAAYACYLLSPSSPFSDPTSAAIDRPIPLTGNPRDEDSLIFAEIAEYARSLAPPPPLLKGQEAPPPGLPQLLPYKLQRAWRAAELGETESAKRYCSAVEVASKPGKSGQSLLPRPLMASLEDLVERLEGEPSVNPANTFGVGSRKAAGKPGLDKLGSWIGGRLTTFIAGDEDDQGDKAQGKLAAPPVKGAKGEVVGPFSHFSTISPGQSGSVTRNPSMGELNGGVNGFAGRAASPGYEYSNAGPGDDQAGYSSWGGGGYAGQDGKDEATPRVGAEDNGDEGDFINPMAGLSLGPSTNDYAPAPASRAQDDGDDDDLGFGNTSLSRNRTPRPAGESDDNSSAADTKAKSKAPAPAKAAAEADDKSKADQGKPAGWLGRWWGGKKEGEHTSGPIKAKLGEESSMVFDKDLKRWVVKGAKGDTSLPAAPPPPPRAQTASPSRALNGGTATPPPSHLAMSSAHPPPPPGGGMPRSSTAPAMAFAQTPEGGIKRMKSGLAESVTAADVAAPPPPPTGASRPPSRPTGASIDDLLSRPPSKRPGSAAAKKGARNRYVDVFQQPGE